MLYANMISEFEKPVVGKTAKTKCFKRIDVSKLNEVWYSNVMWVWMTREMIEL